MVSLSKTVAIFRTGGTGQVFRTRGPERAKIGFGIKIKLISSWDTPEIRSVVGTGGAIWALRTGGTKRVEDCFSD